jgi:rubrerythrin
MSAGTVGHQGAERVRVEVLPTEEFSRRHALRVAAVGGAVFLGSVLIAGLPRPAVSAPSAAQDVEILNFALVLEHMQSRFYEEAAAAGILEGELNDFVEVVRGHEREHVDYLTEALGERARTAPTFAFGNALADADTFVTAAVALEDLGVAAYNGQATNLTRERLAAAATIVSVDARHAAWIRSLAGQTPARQPTDEPLTLRQAQATIDELGFVEGM